MAENLTKKIAIGYLWNLAGKWITRTIGVISTLILIRLLTPADFGIATLANIVMALFVMLSEAGTEKYAINARVCDEQLLNSAWSLNIVLKMVCGGVIALLAGDIARFTHEPVLRPVLLLCAVIPVIGSLKNIGLVYYERELNYQPLTRLSVWVKLGVFPVTVGLAFWLRSYWALMIGSLASQVLMVIGSYWIHDYRPRWSVSQWGKQWHFSKWMMISTTTGYLRSRIDAFLLGRFLPSEAVGLFRVSQEFAWLPFSELIAPATRSLYAGIAKISDDPVKLGDKLVKYQLIAYLLVVPSAFGIYGLQDQIVMVVMGQKWLPAAPVFGLLSFLMLSMPLNVALQTVLTSQSRVRYLVWLDLVMLVAIGLSFSGLHQLGVGVLPTYTQVRVALVVVFIVMLLMAYRILLHVTLSRLLVALLLPMIPAGIMLVVLNLVKNRLPFVLPVDLVLLVMIGGTVFVTGMMLLVLTLRRIIPDYQYLSNGTEHLLTAIRRKTAVK